jgi:hypothetical protein
MAIPAHTLAKNASDPEITNMSPDDRPGLFRILPLNRNLFFGQHGNSFLQAVSGFALI